MSQKAVKSNELIFTKATNNSGGHSKTTVTCWIEDVLSWILFICSGGVTLRPGRHTERQRRADEWENVAISKTEKTDNMWVSIFNIIITNVAFFSNFKYQPSKNSRTKVNVWCTIGEGRKQAENEVLRAVLLRATPAVLSALRCSKASGSDHTDKPWEQMHSFQPIYTH